jgi:hypothetical protein
MRTCRLTLILSMLLLTAGCAHGPSPASLAVPELKLGDFFKRPVGSRGLEPTAELLAMRDKRVRVQGYMVKEEDSLPGLFMLTPVPVNLAELADGPSDFLPPATLFVHLPEPAATQIAAYRPGIWTVTGTVQLGARNEPNERVSYVRLLADDAATILTPAGSPPDLRESGTTAHGNHHH